MSKPSAPSKPAAPAPASAPAPAPAPPAETPAPPAVRSRNLLIPVDGSKESSAAFDYAVHHSTANDKIYLFHGQSEVHLLSMLRIILSHYKPSILIQILGL